jgi:dipeptidyl aminopeptidase/acylaminoacyl peptidase
MKFWFLAGAAAAALIGTPAYAQGARSLADDAAAFGAREAVSEARLSPDGSKVLYVTPGPGLKSFAVISDLQTGKSSVVTSADGEPDTLDWCNYSSPARLVCRASGQVVQTGQIIGFQRLISLNIDGADPKLLGQPRSFYDAALRQFDGRVLDWNGAVDGTVLMQRAYVPEAGRIQSRVSRTKSGLGVDRVDTRTLRVTPVEPPRDAASGFMTDGRGNVRIMTNDESNSGGGLTGRVKYFYRTTDSREWKTLVEFADLDDQIRPLAVDAEINSVYVLKKKDGRRALYTIKLDGSMAERLVAEHPRVDISGVMRSGDGQRVIGYRFSDQQSERVYFDPEFKALSESLSKALPDLPLVNFFDSTMDGRKLLIFAGSDNDPGRYYLFDRDQQTLNEAMLDRPQLEGRTLAQVKSVTIPAPDGAQIPAYLTLPPGRDARNLPAIVLPHGGPSARDYWGFDWIAQFFAARGYAVLQPQYRGSCRVRGRLAERKRVQELAHFDRRYFRFGPLALGARYRQPEPGRHRRLVLRRLCSASVRDNRPLALQGGGRDRSRHRPPDAQAGRPGLYEFAAGREIHRLGAACHRRLAAEARGGNPGAGASDPRRHGFERSLLAFGADA